MILWWYDLILAFICIWVGISIIWVRLNMFAQYGVDALEVQPETDATVKSWNRSFWMKMRTNISSKSTYGFDLFNDISISEWRDTIYTKYGPTIQLVVRYITLKKNCITIPCLHTFIHSSYLIRSITWKELKSNPIRNCKRKKKKSD